MVGGSSVSGPSTSEAEDKVHFVVVGFSFLYCQSASRASLVAGFSMRLQRRSGCYHQCALARQASDLSHGLLCHADNNKYKQ